MCKCTCGNNQDIRPNYTIVRTRSAGVFAGEVSKFGPTVTVKNARRLWYWSGAASLSELSLVGPKSPKGCKFPEEVASVFLTEVIEILPTTEIAQRAIRAVTIWQA